MNDRDRLKWAFENSPSFFQLLTTVRSRRVGRGYRIDSGTELKHPVTGRPMKQAAGPMKFVSQKPPLPLTRLEEALICWAACGPTGLCAWDISMDGGFHELTWIAGRWLWRCYQACCWARILPVGLRRWNIRQF